MSLKKLQYICLIAASFVFTRCAQVAPLNGGDRDTKPPKLLEAVPANASINFTSTTVELKFDEFVQVLDIANQVIVTPQTKELPEIEAKGKKIIIKFNEALITNTTYRLFFGNAIADMHERNILANFEYVFSTGSTIDSLKISGKVENAYTLKKEKEVTVALYKETEKDSAVFNTKPLYFTRTDAGGNYRVQYLPPGKFKAYAFYDKNKNMLYDGGEEMVAYKDEEIETPKDSVINFRVFKEEAGKKYIKKSYSFLYGQAFIVFNKEIMNVVKAYNKKENGFIKSDNSKNDTCSVYYYGIYDTLKLLISHDAIGDIDTLKIPILSKEQFEKQKKEKKLLLDMELEPIEGGKLAFFNNPILHFNKWMDFDKTDTSKIRFTSKDDSLLNERPVLASIDLSRMTVNNKLQQGSEYQFIFDKGAFTDKNGAESDSVAFKFKITSKEDYSTLNLKLTFPQKENYIVQIENNQGKIIAMQFLESSIAESSEKVLKFNNMVPGEYFVKVIEDKNKNKIWDTGNIMMKKQAETIYFNAQAIKLLPDWEAEIEWKISAN